MNTFVERARCFYKKEYDTKPLTRQIQDAFSPSITTIEPCFVALIDRILNISPSKYWNGKTAHQVFDILESCLNSTSGNASELSFGEEAFEYFVMGYSAYEQISETWTDIHDFNISHDAKTRLYRLPMYTSIVESCLANLLRFLADLFTLCSGKDYTVQSKLGPLLDMALSFGLTEITNHVDVNIRNAINHGKVSIRRDGASERILFYYVENHQSRSFPMLLNEFDQRIDDAYDTISGLILGIVLFLNQHISLLKINKMEPGYIPFALFAMELSTPENHCLVMSDVSNNEQINVDMQVSDCKNRDHLIRLAIIMGILVYDRYKNYKKYLISFSHPRMLTGWMRFTNAQIVEMITQTTSPNEIARQVLQTDALFFDPSENVTVHSLVFIFIISLFN